MESCEKENVSLSVIVPVYNAEKYIHRCIISILKQTFQNIEVIVVDDGSVDNSIFIIDELIEKDSRIRLIKQENKGVSAARNEGIKNAKGKYVTFVDADDYLTPNTYECIITSMRQRNISNAIYAYAMVDNISKLIVSLPWDNNTVLDNERIKKELIPLMISGDKENDMINGAVWRTIFDRNIIIQNQFDENIHIQEDLCYCLLTYPQMESLLVINEVQYQYVKHSGSTVERYRPHYYNESLEFEHEIIELLKGYDLYSNLKENYFVKRVGMYSLAISNLFRYDAPKFIGEELEEIIQGYCNDYYIKNNRNLSKLSHKMLVFYILMNMKLKKIICLIYSFKEKKRSKLLK